MRIEIIVRRGTSKRESFAQGSLGESTIALLVRLFGNRQLAIHFVDQFGPPISHLIFEPFYSTARPIGLRVEKKRKPKGRCETKRRQPALNRMPVPNRAQADNQRVRDVNSVFDDGPLITAESQQKQ